MKICVKCLKQQVNRSGSNCEYDGYEKARPEHTWMDYEVFINELHVHRKELFQFIEERILVIQKSLVNNQAKFNERMVSFDNRLDEEKATYNKRLNELKVTHSKNIDKLQAEFDKVQIAEAEYIKVGLPCDVEMKKKFAIRTMFLTEEVENSIGDAIGKGIGVAIGSAIGLVVGVVLLIWFTFKWFFPMISKFLGLEITNPLIIFIKIMVMIVFFVLIFRKPVLKYLKLRKYADSKEFKDELTQKWREKNGFYVVKSNIKAEKETEESKRNDIRRDYESRISSIEWEKEKEKNKYNKTVNVNESRIHSAECALSGSDEDLLDFYKKDNETIIWYLENVCEEDWDKPY